MLTYMLITQLVLGSLVEVTQQKRHIVKLSFYWGVESLAHGYKARIEPLSSIT